MEAANILLTSLLLPYATKLADKIVLSYITGRSTPWIRRQLTRFASRRIKAQAIKRLEGFLAVEMSREEADLFVREFKAVLEGVKLSGSLLAEHDFDTDRVVSELWKARPPDLEIFQRRLDSRFKTILAATVASLVQLVQEVQRWEGVAWRRLFALLREMRRDQEQQNALLHKIHAIVEILLADRQKYPPPKLPLSAPQPYLPRRVSARQHDLGSMHGFLDKGEDLLAVLAAHRRVVLLADAGMGKSWELRRIAHALSKADDPHYPLWDAEFKSYNPSDPLTVRINRFWPFWDAIPDSQRVLIFDGLDEVGQDNVEAVITRFKEFSAEQPGSAIVVSCRAKVFAPFADYLSDFVPYFLRYLDGKAVERYVRDAVGERWDDFSKQASSLKLWDLLNVPFYLALATEVYQQKGKLPGRRGAFFSELIDSRIAKDAGRSVDSGALKLRQKQVLAILSRLALGMEMLCTNEITDDTFVRLVPDQQSRDLLNMSGIWNSVARGDEVYWKFEHNSIQEALAGRLLAIVSSDDVRRCVGVPPDFASVNPSFGNAASFMLEETGDGTILQWFATAAPEIVVQSESTLMPSDQRVAFVKAILNDHKKRGATLVWGKFNTYQLAHFADDPSLLAWLLDEAADADDLRHFASLIRVAQHVTVPSQMADKVRGFYLSLFKDIKRPSWVQRAGVSALSHSRLGTQHVIAEIIADSRGFKDAEFLTEVYRLIRTSKCVDEFISEILAGIETALAQGRLLNERMEIREALSEVTSPAALIRVCDYFTQKPDRLDDVFLSDDFSDFVGNAVNIHGQGRDESVFGAMTRLYAALSKHYQHKFLSAVADFFVQIEVRQAAVDAILAAQIKDASCTGEAVAGLATPAILQNLVERYLRKDVDGGVIDGILYRLPGGEMRDSFLKRLEEVDPEVFRQKARPKCAVLTAQQDFDLLFDQKEYVRQTEAVFEQAGSDTLDWHALHDLRWSPQKDVTLSGMIEDQMRHRAAHAPVHRTAFVEETSKRWDIWSVVAAAEKVTENADINLSAAQREVLAQWCENSIPKVTFAGKKNDRGGTDYQVRARVIICLAIVMDLQLSADECARFLEFPLETLSERVRGQAMHYLSRQLGAAGLRRHIVHIVENRKADEAVLEERYRYCADQKVTEVASIAQRDVADGTLPHNVRLAALRALEALPGGQDAIIPLLPKLQDDLRLIALDTLARAKNLRAGDYLRMLFRNETGVIKDRAAHLLVRYEDQEALRFYTGRIIELGHMPYDDRTDRPSVFASLVTADSIAPLLELLKANYEGKIRSKDPMLDIDGTVRGSLSRIAQQSDEDYQTVRASVKAFLEVNRALWNTGFLHAFLDDLDRQHWMAKAKCRTIDDVISFLQLIPVAEAC